MSYPALSKRLRTSAPANSPLTMSAQMPPNQPFMAPGDPALQAVLSPAPAPPRNARKRKASNHQPPTEMPLDFVGVVPEGMTPMATPSTMPDTGSRKKGRTNTPWTAEEEQRLYDMRDENKGWGEIAKSFPSRTEGSVKKHWYKDMHYAQFTEQEASTLRDAIREYENNKWKTIGQKVGKPAKACERYAKEQFKDV